MNTDLILRINSTNSSDTERLGEHVGLQLKGNEVIELISDLGGGKTTFVRGLAKGLGSTDHVTSPTFTVSKVYKAKNLEMHHFDFYRLEDAGLMEHELHDLLEDPHVVIVVEWGDVVRHVLPEERVTIEFSQQGEDARLLTVHYPQALTYMVKNL